MNSYQVFYWYVTKLSFGKCLFAHVIIIMSGQIDIRIGFVTFLHLRISQWEFIILYWRVVFFFVVVSFYTFSVSKFYEIADITDIVYLITLFYSFRSTHVFGNCYRTCPFLDSWTQTRTITYTRGHIQTHTQVQTCVHSHAHIHTHIYMHSGEHILSTRVHLYAVTD